jgi:hypothetical protein
MADPQQPVVIVDAQGTEHQFPPGFDPKRAAQIVRGQTTAPSYGELARDFAPNALKSLGGIVEQTANAVVHPVDTVTGLGKLALGTVQKMSGASREGVDFTPAADAVGRFYANRYGSLDAAARTALTDPFGMIGDASIVAAPVAGAIRGGVRLMGRAPSVIKAVDRAAALAERVLNPLSGPGALTQAGLDAAGNTAGAITIRPGIPLSKQASLGGRISGRYRIGKEATEKGLWSQERSQANLDEAIRRSQNTVNQSPLPPVEVKTLLQTPETLRESYRRKGAVPESLAELDQVRAKIMRDFTPKPPPPPSQPPPHTVTLRNEPDTMGRTTMWKEPPIVAPEPPAPMVNPGELFDLYKYLNRAANGIFRKAEKEMPGGPKPIEGLAQQEILGNAREHLFDTPNLSNEQRAVQTAMLTDAGVTTALNRPHALTRMLALMQAPSAKSVLQIAMDSPRIGIPGGWALHKGGQALNSDTLRRAMLLRRLEEESQSR